MSLFLCAAVCMLYTNMTYHVQDTIVAIGHSEDDQVHVSNVQEGFQESFFTSDFTQVGTLLC